MVDMTPLHKVFFSFPLSACFTHILAKHKHSRRQREIFLKWLKRDSWPPSWLITDYPLQYDIG